MPMIALAIGLGVVALCSSVSCAARSGRRPRDRLGLLDATMSRSKKEVAKLE